MTTLRSHLVWALMAGTLVIMGPFYIVWNLFTPGGYRSYPLSVLYIKICTLWMGLRIRATGRENLPHSGTCILMPNHRSWWDIPTVQIGAYPHQVRFVSKKEVGKIPLLGTCMTGGGHVLIDRGDRDSAVRTLRDAAARYKGRISLVLFPEGTRSPGHHLLRFKRGGFHLARELGLSIVPVSVAGGERIMKKGSFTILPGTMRVHYHAPIPVPKDADLNVISAAVREKIAAGLREMGEYEEEPPVKGEGLAKGETPSAAAGATATSSAGRLTILLTLAVLFGTGASGERCFAATPDSSVQVGASWTAERQVRAALADSLGLLADEVQRPDPAALALRLPGAGELSLVAALRAQPLRGFRMLESVSMAFEVAAREGDGAVASLAAARQDHPISVESLSAVVARIRRRANEPDALMEAIATFYGGGKRLSGNQRDELRRTAPLVPPGIARAAAGLLFAREEAVRLHGAAFARARLARERLDRKNFDLDVMTWVDSFGVVPDRVEDVLVEAAAEIDWGRLNTGAVLLDQATWRAARELSLLPPEEAAWAGRFVWNTPSGQIVIGGAGNDDYRGPHLLLLDIGGDDQYIGAGFARFPSHTVSLLLDGGGNDRYAPADSIGPGVGGALGGYSVVVDLGGNDEWVSHRLGLGAAVFGAALVYDSGGDDLYESHEFGQGASAWGIGILCDRGGQDRYRIQRGGQGCGGPGGVGILLELGTTGGDSGDVYEAMAIAEAPRSCCGIALHLVGHVQGAGMGVHRDSPGARALAGGFGLLLDSGGNDRYSAGLLAQGVATRDGLGALLDLSGDDEYRGDGSALGTGIAGGVGLFVDAAGNDRYSTGNQSGGAASAGVGFDLGVGIFLDAAGDDDYRFTSGQGVGTLTGFGLFVDARGSDRYAGNLWPPGRISPDGYPAPREHRGLNSAGVFLDLGGDDSYVKAEAGVGNNRRWGTPNADIRFGESISIGLDVNGLPPE